MEEQGFFALVYQELKKVPHGRVTTYGALARAVGRPRMSRFVGYALHGNPDPDNIPCHRVVNREGCLSGAFAFGGIEAQKMLLMAEGIPVNDDNRVEGFAQYLFTDF